VVAHARASFKFRMSKKSSKSGNKKSLRRGYHQSDDEFALDLVNSSAAPAKLKRITIKDDDDEVSGPAIKQEKLSKQEAEPQGPAIKQEKLSKQEAEPHAYPCKGCYRQLAREVEAKLQSRTLSTKTVEVLKLMPHFTADELVDTLVDLLVPPTTSVSLTSPSRVHIQDGDAEWQPLKFPIDIGYFSGTSLEASVEPWWIPKVSLTHNISSGIVGCTHCKLQSSLSKAAVNVFHFFHHFQCVLTYTTYRILCCAQVAEHSPILRRPSRKAALQSSTKNLLITSAPTRAKLKSITLRRR
jgi:hypothetical protein